MIRARLCKYLLVQSQLYLLFLLIRFPILFVVRFALHAVPRCRLPGCSIASSEPRCHVSVPSIFASVMLISHPSSACAHAYPLETHSLTMICSHTGAPGLHQAHTDPVLVVFLPDYFVMLSTTFHNLEAVTPLYNSLPSQGDCEISEMHRYRINILIRE